jgi:hypothetical protein
MGKALGLGLFPGAFTPTEILAAYEAGADGVKVFPASALGPSYIKAVRAPLSHIPLLAVGGINEKNAAEFLRAGCVGLGVGGTLVVQWPMFGGKAKFGGGYLKAERAEEKTAADKFDVTRCGLSAGFYYNLSKTTHLYVDAGYFHQKEETLKATTKSHGSEFVMGMVHYF